MPATAIQKKAFFQCRCTNGAKRGRNLMRGAFVSVSLGFKFCGTASLPCNTAVLATAFCRGRLPRVSVPGPIVLFFRDLVAVPCVKVRPVLFFTWVDLVVLRVLGLCTTCGCRVREGTLRTLVARPLDAASVGVASKNVRATTAAATADTTIVV